MSSESAKVHMSVSTNPQHLELGQAEARSLELHRGLPMDGRGQSSWNIFHCFPRCICRQLDQKQSMYNSDCSSVCDALILDGSLACWATTLAPTFVFIKWSHNLIILHKRPSPPSCWPKVYSQPRTRLTSAFLLRLLSPFFPALMSLPSWETERKGTL